MMVAPIFLIGLIYVMSSVVSGFVPTPSLERFNWEAKGSYLVKNGHFRTRVMKFPGLPDGSLPAGPTTSAQIALDTANKRMAIRYANNTAFQWLYQNGSYIILSAGAPCERVDFTYQDQISSYANAGLDEMLLGKQFTGLVSDVASCNHLIAVNMAYFPSVFLEGYLQRWSFAQEFFLFPNGPALVVVGIIWFDSIFDIDDGQPSEAFFTLPSECATPGDYCSNHFGSSSKRYLAQSAEEWNSATEQQKQILYNCLTNSFNPLGCKLV